MPAAVVCYAVESCTYSLGRWQPSSATMLTSSTASIGPDMRRNAQHAALTGSIGKRSALMVMLRSGTHVEDSQVRCSVAPVGIGMTMLILKPAEQTVTLSKAHLCR